MPATEPDDNDAPSPANPFSTGSGTVFECHVHASLVATLLVRGILPCLPPSQVTAVHLQAGHLGLRTDDVMCEAVDSQQRTRRFISQIKHQIRVSTKDTEFKGTVKAGWLDFQAMTEERRELDSFALITGPISSVIASDFRTMLEWARSAADGADFFRRMAIAKYASNTARAHLQTIREICDDANGAAASDDDLWRFLRCYHLLSFDFDVADGQDLARVKTMLALAAQPRDVASGDALWNKIFHLVSQQNPRAGSLTHDTLPDDLTAACGSLAPHFDHGPVRRLREHAGGVLRRIRTTIGDMKPLPRDEPRRQLAEAIEEHPFVVVTGPAGASKSALSRMTFEQCFADAPLFAFQATEFARVHLDQVLSELRLTVGLSELSALFALHRRKCLLIESVERLLETEPREAFSMFLDEIAADKSWRVVFTCRQYSLEQVQEAFFRPCGISPKVVGVPLFNDEELRVVAEAVPALAPLLTDDRTRRLLRNPYFLGKAALVNWGAADSSQPLDERRLRDTLWRQVVMREDLRRDGLPLKRERCFRAVALRRAKTMRAFVPYDAGDEAALQALLDDELLIRDAESGGVATAHDVLEDWALVREVRVQFERTGGQPTELFCALGHELAMRRSYRHWLHESLEGEDADAIFRFATAVIGADEVEAYWRDETLVSVMLSEHADQYVRSEESALLADDKSLLRRAAHLLRVACKQPNPLLPRGSERAFEGAQSLYLVPDGPGWDASLRLIERNLQAFTGAELPWVLGLLNDWRSSIVVGQPSPVAAREAGLIALHFWRLTEDAYVNREDLHGLAGVLLAAPQEIRAEFEALLIEIAGAEWEYHDAQLAERLLTSLDGIAACRTLPAAVARFASHAWGLDRPAPERPDSRGFRERDSWFGLGDAFHLRLWPPSAIHGPFYFILQGDPQIGQRLIVDLVNTAIERVTDFVRQNRPGSEPISVEVRIDNRTTVRHWADDQFWRMYWEPCFGPDVVTCALMALEKWLLELGERGADLREVCLGLLAASNNVALTAVVASVAIAYPERVGDVVLSLLRVPQFFAWDQVRSAAGQISMDALLAGISIPAHRIYNEERKQSAKLPHRSRNLEWLATALQFTEMRDAIQNILDDHRAALPPKEEQSESMRTWRLLLHRVDLRRHTVERDPGSGGLVFTSTMPEPDLQRMVEEHAPIAAAHDEQMRLMNWGLACFNRKTEHHDPSRWPEVLASSERLIGQLPDDADEHERLMVCGGGAYIAAVCVRDHWQEMQPGQRAWCRSLLVKAVAEHQDSRDQMVEASRFPMHGSRPAARVLPLLLSSDADEENAPIRLAIAGAVTHASDEVRDFAARGIRDYLWGREPQTAWACIAGLVRWSEIRRECYREEQRQPWNERRDFADAARARLPELRASIAAGAAVQPQDVLRLDLSDWCGTVALTHLLLIVGGQPQSELAQQFHHHVAEGLVRMWARDRREEQRDYHAEAAGMEHLAFFLLRAPPSEAGAIFQPIIAAIGAHSADVAQFLEQLVIAEDQLRVGDVFWSLWQRAADAFLAIERWEYLLTSGRHEPAHLIESLFLQRVEWKADARDWAPLHGHEQSLEALFERTGHCAPAFSAFCGLLGSIGSKRMLPSGINLLSGRLTAGEPRRMLAGRMTLWNLEAILAGCIYGTPSVIRTSARLLAATMYILDQMVEQGSSAAFRMREFIITPVGSAN